MNYFLLNAKLQKHIFSYKEVLKAFPAERVETIQRSLSRLVKLGSLKRIKRGFYLDWHVNSEQVKRELAAAMYYPSIYLGDLTILTEYGVLSNTLPHLQKNEMHLTATKLQRDFSFDGTKYVFSEFADELFFGFEEKFSELLQAAYLEVKLEKALLDYLYRYGFKVIEDLNVDLLPEIFNLQLYRDYAQRFPKRVQKYVVF
jgi:predicted transcriptional regulator of viral defense system